MKKYIIKILSFSFLLISFLVASFLLNNFLFDKVHHQFFTSRKIDTIIIGDSHLKNLNEDAIRYSLNMSQPGEPYPLMYFKLKETLKYTTPKKVVIGFSYNNISHHSDIKYNRYAALVINRLYSIESFSNLLYNTERKKEALSILMRKLFTPNIKFIKHYLSKDTIEELPFYEYEKNEDFEKPRVIKELRFSKPKLNKRIKRHFNYANTGKKLGEKSILYLKKIIELCEDKNIEVHLLNMPLHKSYRGRIPNFYRIHYNELRKELKEVYSNIYIQDFKALFDKRPELFTDPDHVNQWGAIVMSKKINKRFQKNK